MANKQGTRNSFDAVSRHPYLPRESFFTESDYKASCSRVEAARKQHDSMFKIKPVGNKKVKTLTESKPRYRSVNIDGNVYGSTGVAAKELCMDISLIRSRIASIHFPNYGYIDTTNGDVCKQADTLVPNARRKKVIVKGVEYASITSAARTLHMTTDTVRNRISNGSYPEWVFKDESA